MSSEGTAGDSDFIAADVDPSQHSPKRSRVMSRGLAVIGVIVAICVAVPLVLIYLKQSDLESQLQRRLEILSQGRAEVVETWLEGALRPTERVVDSELFRLFATEMDIINSDISSLGTGPDADADADFQATLAEQLPYMERVLSDFAQNVGFVEGHVINREGVAYVSTAGALQVTSEQRTIAQSLFDTGLVRFGPARRLPSGVVMDFFVPIYEAQSEIVGGQYTVDSPEQSQMLADLTVGVLVLTAPIDDMLLDVLTPPPLSEAGERLVLVQQSGAGLMEVDPKASPPIQAIDAIEAPAADGPIPFSERAAVGEANTVYSAGSPVAGTSWWVVQEIDVQTAQAMIGGFIMAVLVVAGLVVVAVVAAFGAFWWRLSNEHSTALAEQFRRLAGRIDAQRKFLNSINSSIAEYIGVKSKEGKYRYLNPAFAVAVGRDAEEAIGLDDAALFGQGTAGRLAQSDRSVLEQEATVTFNAEVYLDSRLHHLQISKAPYHDDSGQTAGVVSVMRDVTELVEEQHRRERAMHQMVSSLVRAVELRDPYLAGHSRRLAGFARAVAEELGGTSEEISTVEIAANLSQIGKLAVPVEVLTKPGRLSEAEIAQLQSHIQHAAIILRDIDFDLPVLETVTGMHERLDGKGYPARLSGDQIPLTARILGACDVFCARIEPRVYRSGITPNSALDILDQNDGRYDPQVIAALRKVAASVTGEKLVADLKAG
jgi:PAS domain S-box-containing protein